ncbi:MAG: 2-amino-4-hydroxy-6-hydroxymethyldihydropteridine diphosphokinase [Deltaproteobacteria bacterium]
MARVFLGLGSNLGNRKENLREAVQMMSAFTEIVMVSSAYETEPVGNEEQPDFLNCAVEIKTSLPPRKLLAELKAVEDKLGRVRKEKWGPRTIDIDIIFYDNLVIDSDELNIPHPGSHLRRFVLEPLSEISPDFIHPALDVPLSQLLDKLEDSKSVRKAGSPSTLFPQPLTAYKQK